MHKAEPYTIYLEFLCVPRRFLGRGVLPAPEKHIWPQMNTDEPLMAGGPATLNDEKERQLGQ